MAKKLFESKDYHEAIARLILANLTNKHAEHRIVQDSDGDEHHEVWNGAETRPTVPPEERPTKEPETTEKAQIRLSEEDLQKIGDYIAAKLRADEGK